MQVDFYSGPNATGDLLGTITRKHAGNRDALLYGAHTTEGFRSVVITDLSGDSFAIAQIRV